MVSFNTGENLLIQDSTKLSTKKVQSYLILYECLSNIKNVYNMKAIIWKQRMSIIKKIELILQKICVDNYVNNSDKGREARKE